MELVLLLAIGGFTAAAGVLVGLRLAPRIERWTEEREESDDHGRS